MGYQWLLFDADGTLFDFDACEARAFARTLEEHGVPPDSSHLAHFREVSQACWDAFARGAMTSTALRIERFVRWQRRTGAGADPEALSGRYLQNLAQGTDLIAGAKRLLAGLSARFRFALITNGLSDVQRPRLAACEIGHHFEAVVISDEEGVAKPHPGLFEIAFARMDHPARHEVLMIGDNLAVDIRGGSDFGLDTCWFNPGRLPNSDDVAVTHEIRHLDELTLLLGG